MVKVSIEVHNGAALFKVAVRAQSIEQAASIVTGSYPGVNVSKVVGSGFPLLRGRPS